MYLKEKIDFKFDENISLGEDLIFNIKYINKIENITYLDNSLYVYDTCGENSLTKMNHHAPDDFFELYSKIYSDIYVYNKNPFKKILD